MHNSSANEEFLLLFSFCSLWGLEDDDATSMLNVLGWCGCMSCHYSFALLPNLAEVVVGFSIIQTPHLDHWNISPC
jgi:hypothetical protein